MVPVQRAAVSVSSNRQATKGMRACAHARMVLGLTCGRQHPCACYKVCIMCLCVLCFSSFARGLALRQIPGLHNPMKLRTGCAGAPRVCVCGRTAQLGLCSPSVYHHRSIKAASPPCWWGQRRSLFHSPTSVLAVVCCDLPSCWWGACGLCEYTCVCLMTPVTNFVALAAFLWQQPLPMRSRRTSTSLAACVKCVVQQAAGNQTDSHSGCLWQPYCYTYHSDWMAGEPPRTCQLAHVRRVLSLPLQTSTEDETRF